MLKVFNLLVGTLNLAAKDLDQFLLLKKLRLGFSELAAQVSNILEQILETWVSSRYKG